MSLNAKKNLSILFISVLFLSACGSAHTFTPELVFTEASSESTQSSVVTPSPVATLTESPVVENATNTSQVIFTANKGYINIRRGPHMSYNPVGSLKPGQSVIVHGRDLLGEWAMIDLPSSPGKSGWVSLKTPYSQLQGDIFSLPEVQVDFATPAYIRNCTLHNMTLEPTGEQLFNIQTYPNNQLKVSPGSYKVYDNDSVEYTEVLSVFIVEGNIIDITIDGDQNKHKCN